MIEYPDNQVATAATIPEVLPGQTLIIPDANWDLYEQVTADIV